MNECEYYQLVSFLESIITLIARKDWEGALFYSDELIESMIGNFVNPGGGDVQMQERIKDLAAHMLAIKQIVLKQVAVVSSETGVMN